jgi:hypothetical protein
LATAALGVVLAITQTGSAARGSTGSQTRAGAGPSLAYEAYRDGGVVLPGARQTIATLNVPSGSYAIQSKTVLADDSTGSVYVFCYLNVSSPSDEDSSAALVGRNVARQTVGLMLTHTFLGAGKIVLSCQPTRPATSADVVAEMSRIVAVKVDSITRSAVTS